MLHKLPVPTVPLRLHTILSSPWCCCSTIQVVNRVVALLIYRGGLGVGVGDTNLIVAGKTMACIGIGCFVIFVRDVCEVEPITG